MNVPVTRSDLRECRSAGFTLLEVLVAVAILAIMGVLMQQVLMSVLQAREAADRHGAQLRQMQKAQVVMQRDIGQMLPRVVRDEFGDVQPALILGKNQLVFTRLSVLSPAFPQRSAVLRVEYSLQGDKLLRRQWTMPDRARDAKPSQTVLLTGVHSLQVRVLDESNNWKNDWPGMAGVNIQPREQVLPRAIEIVVDTETYPAISRLWLLPVNPYAAEKTAASGAQP